MAFIREYAEQGDPFSFRIPKRLRKMKVGRALGGLARVAAPFALGGLAGVALSRLPLFSKLQGIAAKYGVAPGMATEVARQYGLDVGDHVGDPEYDDVDVEDYGSYIGDPGRAPKPAKKRKTAGAGPKAKAAKKRAKRRERRARGVDVGAVIEAGLGAIPAVGGVAQELLAQQRAARAGIPLPGGGFVPSGGPGPSAEDQALAEMMAAMGGKRPKGMRAPRGLAMFGRKRRTMNPANVRALRHSMRRVEGFQKLVKRVGKMFPALRGHATHAMGPARHYARGHKAGCACVVCRRAA